MPSVTVTLSDTPTGQVAVHTDFKPAIGASCSPAQSAALDLISRTRRDWSTPAAHQPTGHGSTTFAQPKKEAGK